MIKDLLLIGYVVMKFCFLNFVFILFFEWYDILVVVFFSFFFIYFCKLFFVFRYEDGTVRFWDVFSIFMLFLYKLFIVSFFNVEIYGDYNSGEVEEEWLFFRKVYRGMVMVLWRIRIIVFCMVYIIIFIVLNFNWVFIIFYILL